MYRRGELDEALRIRRDEELPVYERLGDVRERAVTRGNIADILADRGELDEALRIRREEQLPVYERVGDVRERSVTRGKIADILYRRGELDEARKLQERRLAVNRELFDVEEIAATLWSLAQLDLAGDDVPAAMSRLAEAWSLLEQLERVDGLAIVGDLYGQLLLAADERDEAHRVLGRSIDAYQRLGQGSEADRLMQVLRDLDKRATVWR